MEQNIKFKFKYAKTVLILLSLVIALSAIGLVWNLINIFGENSSTDSGINQAFKYLVLAVNLLILLFSISVLAYGRYIVDNSCVLCKFGLICSKYKAEEILSITHFKKSNKLVMYFKDEKFTVIVISPDKYGDFVKAVKKINSSVIFSDEQENN